MEKLYGELIRCIIKQLKHKKGVLYSVIEHGATSLSFQTALPYRRTKQERSEAEFFCAV